jgi:tetratricopeptide (TPR) repeat protein
MPDTPSSERASAWEWVRTALLAANIAWTTACLGGYLPGSRALMSVLTAALVAVHFADPLRGRRAHPAGWLFLPFVVYSAANAAWVTPLHWLGWIDWLNWAQAIAIFWVALNGIAARSCWRTLLVVIVALGVVSALLAGYQHFVKPEWLMLGRKQVEQYAGRASGIFGYPNCAGIFMALLIPPVGALALGRDRPAALRLASGVVLVALAAGFVLAISRGAWLALAAAFALRALLAPGRSLGRRIAGAAIVTAVAVAAAAAVYGAYPQMRVRVAQMAKDVGEHSRPIVWRAAWNIFREHPVVGSGAGSYDTFFEAYRPEGFLNRVIYAHCDYLNVLSDYGAVGFVLLFGAAAVVLWRCAGSRGLAGAAYTGLLAVAVHILVDWDLNMPALAMVVAVVAAFVTSEAWPTASPAPSGPAGFLARAAGLGLAAAVLGFTLLRVVPLYRAEETRRAAREKIDKMSAAGVDDSKEHDAIASFRESFERATLLDPTNAQAWADRAYADSLWSLVNPGQTVALGADVEREARRALDLCPVVAEFWIRRGTGCDMQYRWIEGGSYYARALQLAPMRPDVWYYQAYHLSLKETEDGPALAAADLCLRLDPSFLLAQSLRQRLGSRLQKQP